MTFNRIALLPIYPYLPTLEVWARMYKEAMKDTGCKTFACVGHPDAGILSKACDILDRNGIRIFSWPDKIPHGQALNKLFRDTIKEDSNFLILEDDCYVKDGSTIDKCFGLLDGGELDIVAAPMTWTEEINAFGTQKYLQGVVNQGVDTVGPGFLPTMCFLRGESLLKTDLNFDEVFLPEGIPILKTGSMGSRKLNIGFTPKSEVTLWIGQWVALQMLENGLKRSSINQYRVSPCPGNNLLTVVDEIGTPSVLPDISNYPWVHVGQMAYVVDCVLPRPQPYLTNSTVFEIPLASIQACMDITNNPKAEETRKGIFEQPWLIRETYDHFYNEFLKYFS